MKAIGFWWQFGIALFCFLLNKIILKVNIADISKITLN